ncbi:MAG: hypothetical protein ACPLW9_02510 [Minisyncoccales bacterium]
MNAEQEYTREQFWEIFQKLPRELQEAIFSAETADYIRDICLRNKIGGDIISEVARYTGRVLMGILTIEEFQKLLTTKLKIEEDVAKNIFHEINRFIFNPVRDSLAAFQQEKVAPTAAAPTAAPRAPSPPPESSKPVTPQRSERRDIYREPIE